MDGMDSMDCMDRGRARRSSGGFFSVGRIAVGRIVGVAAFVAALGVVSSARAGIWTPDPAKANWGEDEIYAAHERWLSGLPPDFLDGFKNRMEEIARARPDGAMDRLYRVKGWDCSCTPVFLWVRFLYEHRLPFRWDVYVVPKGKPVEEGYYVPYTHDHSGFDAIADREERFLHFARMMQDTTWVHDVSADHTYPIALSALQGGVVNLTNTHSRVLAGVDRDPTRAPLLVTGHWVYTDRWDAAAAFSELGRHQTADGNLGLRLFRVTVRSGGGYRTLRPEEHRRFGGTEQFDAGREFLKKLFAANGREYDPTVLLVHARDILIERIDYRRAYIRRHPGEETTWSQGTTQNNDRRFAGLLRTIRESESDPKIVERFGEGCLSRTTFPMFLLSATGEDLTEEVPIDVFAACFQRFLARLSNPKLPERERWLTGRDFLIHALEGDAARLVPLAAKILAAAGETVATAELPPKHRAALAALGEAERSALAPFLR